MDASHQPTLTQLRRGAVRRIAGRPGRGIAVFQGQLWITQYKDPRDLFVGAGESFSFDRRGPVVVQAFTDTSMLLFDVAADQSSAPAVAPAAPRAQPAARTPAAKPLGLATAAAACR